MTIELENVRAFLKVAELSNFTRAAAQLGVSKSRVSLAVSALEASLGSRLLTRSTRTVQLTSDGAQFRHRAVALLEEADELGAMFQAPSTLKGRLRVDLPVNLARDFIIPRLPEFVGLHPQLEIQMSTTDRRVDLLREGFDCVLRVGKLDDSSLAIRRVGSMPMVNVASAAYVARHGVPRTIDDLDQHLVVHYSGKLDSEPPGFEYLSGKRYIDKPMRAVVTVNNADAYNAACMAGLGIVQVPRMAMRERLVSGAAVEILAQYVCEPLQVAWVHAYSRTVPARVKAFMDWVARLLKAPLGAA